MGETALTAREGTVRDGTARERLLPTPLITGEQTDGTLNKSLNDYIWQAPKPGWWTMMAVGMALTGLLFTCIAGWSGS